MQFFLFDFALALVALLGYRTLVVATGQGAPAAHPRPAPAPSDIARPHRRFEPRPTRPPWLLLPGRPSLHRLINFW